LLHRKPSEDLFEVGGKAERQVGEGKMEVKVTISEEYEGNTGSPRRTFFHFESDREEESDSLSEFLETVNASKWWKDYPPSLNPDGKNVANITVRDLIDTAARLGISPVELLQKLVDYAHREDRTTLWEGIITVGGK
jgi:hypothetical protein